MNRRGFLASIVASLVAVVLGRKIAPIQAIEPGDTVFLREGTYGPHGPYSGVKSFEMGWEITQEALDGDLYGLAFADHPKDTRPFYINPRQIGPTRHYKRDGRGRFTRA